MSSSQRKVKRLLVAGGLEENWYKVFEGTKITLPDGEYDVCVEQASWEDLTCCSYSDSGITCLLNSAVSPVCDLQKKTRNFIPDFLFYRGLCRTIGCRSGRVPDYRNVLYGFVHAGTPMMNSFEAILTELDRPLMYSVLKKINFRLGQEKFPIIPQSYFPDHSEFLITPDIPFVAKISFPHAGFGKMVVKSSEQKEDLKSVLALHNDYCVCEPFINRKSELRIVSIGDYSRAHKRDAMQWKVNAGGNEREDTEMTDKYKLWVSELKKELPGLSYFSIDSIEDTEGNEYILEFNGSTTGLPPEHSKEYYHELQQLVLAKMTEAFSLPKGFQGKQVAKPEELTDMYNVKKMEDDLHKLRSMNSSLLESRARLNEEVTTLYKKTRTIRYSRTFFRFVLPIFIAMFVYLVIFYFKNK